MENAIKVFSSNEFGQMRIIEISGEPWFVGKDVAEILGYKNPQEAIRNHVDDLDKGVSEILTPGGKQLMPIINESGLYSLIMSSKLPKAREFKRWVTSEVLPSLRKHGAYIDMNFADKGSLIGLLRTAASELEAKDVEIRELTAQKMELTATVAVKDQQIAEMTPKAGYYDVVLSCPDALAISIIAKDYGMSAKALNSLLAGYGVQYKQGDIWLIKAKYQDRGYTRTKTTLVPCPDGSQRPKVHTYWTQKGRLFLYEFLKKYGVLPLCEVRDDEVA